MSTAHSLSAWAFGDLAQRLAAAARSMDLEAPSIQSPPRIPGATRTRELVNGRTLIRLDRNRPAADVEADMIEAVVVVNELTGTQAAKTRRALAEALHPAIGARSGRRLSRAEAMANVAMAVRAGRLAPEMVTMGNGAWSS